MSIHIAIRSRGSQLFSLQKLHRDPTVTFDRSLHHIQYGLDIQNMKVSLCITFVGLTGIIFNVSAFSASKFPTRKHLTFCSASTTQGYVPEGFSPKEWEQQKKRDHEKNPRKHFRSRPLVDFQQDLEKGKAHHLFPVMFAKRELKAHHIEPNEVPYMQRQGGTFNDSDVPVNYIPEGTTKQKWKESLLFIIGIYGIGLYLSNIPPM